MTKQIMLTLLLAAVAMPAMAQTAAPTATATALPTVTKASETATGATVTTTTTPIAVSGGVGPGGAMIATQTTINPGDIVNTAPAMSATTSATAPMAPSADMGMPVPATAPAPVLGAAPAPTAADLLNANGATPPPPVAPAAMNAQPPVPPVAPVMPTQTMPVTQAAADTSGNPLCAAVHTPSADVAAAPAPVKVGTPKMIPLSVDLAGALGIQGFQNIVSEGPIGFITVNDQGRVFFEGQDLSTNVANMCASGNIPAVPAAIKQPMMGNVAPDGSQYAAAGALPGQTGFRMQPIVDGPSYKTPPKRKKAAPKKAEVKKEELTEQPKADVTTETEASTSTTSDENLGSMLRTAPATTETVPMAPKPETPASAVASDVNDDNTATTAIVPADQAGLPDTTGAAVSEVLNMDGSMGSTGATEETTPAAPSSKTTH